MLTAYRRHATTARLVFERWQARNSSRAAILMYHRIATPASDPWRIAVSPENFAAHMDVLKHRGDTRRLSDAVRCLAPGAPVDQCVAVTFDDGYVDNLTHALPILEARSLPATVFVCSGLVGIENAFWWDLLSRVFLETPELPETLTLTSDAEEVSWNFGEQASYSSRDLARSARWVADEEAPSDPRQIAFLEVWEFLVGLDPVERRTLLARIADWAGVSEVPIVGDIPRPVTEEELRQLSGSEVIDIGGHTRTHPDLASLPSSRAKPELENDRADLAEMTGQTASAFAFPYGRCGPKTVQQITSAGYGYACWSRLHVATPSHDLYRLPRIQVPNISGDQFARRLNRILGPAVRQAFP